MTAIFDFVCGNCKLDSNAVYSEDKKIAVVSTNGTCSTADILRLYQQYGEDCVHHFQGVVAFCLWDENRRQLLCVRDRIGEKSLYYAQLPCELVVSSVLKDILPHIRYTAIVEKNLAQAIRYNYPIDLQQTWIEQIKRVCAGEMLIVDKNGVRSKIYWRRNHTPSFHGTKQEAIAESLRLMQKSVKQCIDATEGPVAVLLSGGIDSTSLAVFAKEVLPEVHVICAGYKGNQYKACDERQDAKRFAQEKGLIYHEVVLDQDDFRHALDELIPYLDEPCFDVSSMAQYMLYKKASEMGYKTILSGLGGDEQFYSYVGHHKEQMAIQLRHEFNQLYPYCSHKKEWLRFVARHWKSLLLPTESHRIGESMLVEWTYRDYKRFVETAQLGNVAWKDIDVHISFAEDISMQGMYDFLTSTFAINMCVYLGNTLCNANGIKLCCPLLDPELVAFLDSLPMEMKFDANHPKQFQKDCMAGLIPDYILYAKKRGFEPPFEFVKYMCKEYRYKHIQADYCFFNSMLADRMIDNLLQI